MRKTKHFLLVAMLLSVFASGLAQENKTSLLKNADMEQGLKGWAFDGINFMGKSRKDVNTQVGFHGMNSGVQEMLMDEGDTALVDGFVMQRLNDLPSGTYVFGAYVGAAKYTQGQEWSNCDSVIGVSLRANNVKTAVATDSPDLGNEYRWAHSKKFNVAVRVPDEDNGKGCLDVGLRVGGTNANYVVWDNATLYYFGNMSEDAALDAMAEIDMANAVAIADTLVGIKMNADTLNNLNVAIEKAKSTITTAATLWDDSEELFWNMGLARKSATDYENLKKDIEFAKTVQGGTWSEDGMNKYYAGLADAVETAEKVYEEAKMNRAELTELRANLAKTAGWMQMDSLHIALAALDAFINTPDVFTNEPGKYSVGQQKMLMSLQDEVSDSLSAVEEREENARPQDLYPYIVKIYEAIEAVRNNPVEASRMPTVFKPTEEVAYTVVSTKCYPIQGTVINAQGLAELESPLFIFEGKVETLRITVRQQAAGGYWKYFCLSELEFYDGDGNRIELTAANVTSNADHNTLNPGREDGGGIPALFDGDTRTYFHSAWQNMPSEDHYLEITLPNGGYDAFSFKMLSRDGSGNNDQKHTFPGEMIVDIPRPQREALGDLIDRAKGLNPYSFPEVGYYSEDFSCLTEAITEAQALVDRYASEAECDSMSAELLWAIEQFEMSEVKTVRLPEAGKVYRVVSAYPGFYEIQSVEKAITVNAANNKLWWQDVCADSLQQEFVFEPIMKDGEHCVGFEVDGQDEEGNDVLVPYYCYTMKHVATGLYVNVAGYSTPFQLAEEPVDTVMLKWLGRGQWNIIVKEYDDWGYGGSYCMHAGDHNSGNPSTSNGAYGGTYGVSSGIMSWTTGIDGASAWYICEMPEMPLTVLAAEATDGDKFKSECIHFEAANTITLTADKVCAFDDLKLYDLYGNIIAIDNLVISGRSATITQKNNLVACAFAFTNNEGVASVSFNAYIPKSYFLQEAYDGAVAVNPQEGTGIGQYADISAYEAAIAVAEELLENGGTDEAMDEAIIALEEAVEALTLNMPVADKVYCIYSALPFEENWGYKMVMSSYGSSNIRWKNESYLDLNQYWQFEPVSAEQLKKAGMDAAKYADCTYFIKSVATNKYIGELNVHDGMTEALTDIVSEATPFVITRVGDGSVAFYDGYSTSLHAYGHRNGSGKGGNIISYSASYAASAWHVVETEHDLRDSEDFVPWTDSRDVIVNPVGAGRVGGGGVYTIGTEVSLIATPEEGYHFVQWSDGSTENPYTFLLSQNVDLKATFAPNTYHITFMVDGVVVKEEDVPYGDVIEQPARPNKEGYTFIEWDRYYYKMPAYDVTLNAAFSVNSYWVNFVYDDYIIESRRLEYGTPIEYPDTVDLEGHTFLGWDREYDVVPAHRVTVKGNFDKNKYRVSFMIGTMEFESYILEYGSAIVAPDALELPGYTFCGWGEVAQTVPAHDVTYYADYIPQVYSVFYFVEGQLVHVEKVAYGEVIPEYVYNPTDEGYVFVGWNGDAYETMPAHDISYTANITSGVLQFTVGNERLIVYDLSGRKMQVNDLRELQKGVYIINGRKVVVK